MDIFGLTPVDTALSVLGLNYAQLITDYIFNQTPIGFVVFVIAVVLCVLQLVNTGHYRPLIAFFFISLTILLLLLPSRNEGTIKSALERYATVARSSQTLKDQVSEYHVIPVILAFASQVSDSLAIALIDLIDIASPDWARYLTAPFLVQRACLYIREAMDRGIAEPKLLRDLEKFCHDFYVPALTMLRHETPGIKLGDVWPGDGRVSAFYSGETKRIWDALADRIKNYFYQDPHFSVTVRGKIGLMTRVSSELVDQALIRSMVQSSLDRQGHKDKSESLWSFFYQALNFYPYIYGCANLLLHAFFPLMLLMLVVVRRLSVFYRYLRVYVWVKLCLITGALSFYASLFMARIQQQNATTDPSWAWEKPYFCIMAVLMLAVMPLLTLVFINTVSSLKGGHV